jgi:biotin carboxylase
MAGNHTLTILCLTSYDKGERFMRECAAQGCRVLLLTLNELQHISWPRECLEEVYFMPDLTDIPAVINGVSYLARGKQIDRIVPLDEYDMMLAATLREHFRLPGMGESATRLIRDKLAMRVRAREMGVPVPAFTPVFNDEVVATFLAGTPAPWMLKPRAEASTIGIAKLTAAEDVWRHLTDLGDRRSSFLMEQYIAGDVYHADAIVADGVARFVSVQRYGRPPLDVFHDGGAARTCMLERGSADQSALRDLNQRVITALEVKDTATHMEFIKGRDDGQFYFLEVAARVGGAYISDVIEAATGVNLWTEWARLECTPAGRQYVPPTPRPEYAGVIISLARQESPDTSAYTDPEIVWRLSKASHVGMIVVSPSASRVESLLDQYAERFATDFVASLPPWTERPPADS